jgi:hypothetical protein
LRNEKKIPPSEYGRPAFFLGVIGVAFSVLFFVTLISDKLTPNPSEDGTVTVEVTVMPLLVAIGSFVAMYKVRAGSTSVMIWYLLLTGPIVLGELALAIPVFILFRHAKLSLGDLPLIGMFTIHVGSYIASIISFQWVRKRG